MNGVGTTTLTATPPAVDADTRAFFEGVARTLARATEPAASPSGSRMTVYESVLDALPFAVAVFSPDHRYRFLNPSAIKNSDIRAWIIGRDDFEYCRYRGYEMQRAEIRRRYFLQAVAQRDITYFEEALSTPQGETRHYWRHFFPVFEGDDLQMVIGYSIDITALKRAEAELKDLNQQLEQRVRDRTAELENANQQLERTALYDPLTGLPNRTLLHDRLAQALETCGRDPAQGFALLFLDADRFKTINDTLGHAAGDSFLRAFGRRLGGCVRGGDTVARFGGDEFVILLRTGSEAVGEQAVGAAERIRAALARPFRVAGRRLTMTSSIGVVSDVRGYNRPGDIMRDADIAMYAAKAAGGATYQVFIRGVQTKSPHR